MHRPKAAPYANQCWVACESRSPSLPLGYGTLNRSFLDRAFIALVVVRKDARREGVATAIMELLEAECARSGVFTPKNASNLPMRALLKRSGYVDSGRIDNLDDADPELVFVKFISL
ncbi:GNAT family N-acetyltransferase [Paraburkholderia sabiae]|uniref:GNAT family N-acetyltransferase n=1 Tax=Paraburkholderia sabiae TaxID=273251 RepID=UPI0036272B4F